MSKYLALSDLDDTLLTKDKTITDSTVAFIKEFRSQGNVFSICTGRPYSGCYLFYERLGSKGPLITDNGCAIYNLDGKNKFFEIPLGIYQEFLEKTLPYAHHIYSTSGYKHSYAYNLTLVPDWIIHNELGDLKVVEIENAYECKHAPLISNFWVKKDCLDSFLVIMEEYKDQMFYRNWGLYEDYYSIEIHSAHASKGLALRYLKEYYKIDDDKTMAFGDQLNDLSMIEEAYYGVAMVNAVSDLKDRTNYQTDRDFDHDGVIDFIIKHKLY